MAKKAAVVVCESPRTSDLYFGLPTEGSVFAKADTVQKMEWVLKNIREQKLNPGQYAALFPIDEPALVIVVQEQLLKQIEAKASIGLIDDFMSTLVILDKETVVWLKSIRLNPVVRRNAVVRKQIHFYIASAPVVSLIDANDQLEALLDQSNIAFIEETVRKVIQFIEIHRGEFESLSERQTLISNIARFDNLMKYPASLKQLVDKFLRTVQV